MYLLIYVIPILNMVCLNRKLGKSGVYLALMNTSLLLFTVLIILFYDLHSTILIDFGHWMTLLNLDITWKFQIDPLTKSMLFPIVLISSLVQLYSSEYMGQDPHLVRFMLLLQVFTLAMILLVTGENLLTLFLGWELVGLASYLLVNFWYTMIAANHGGLKALLMNRFGDLGLTIAICLWYSTFGSLEIALQYLAPESMNTYFLGLCIILGAMAKSAQVGLHSWLTAAMVGPTPVSSLLHSATMVTAGVYLVMRLSVFLEWSEDILLILLWLGGLSALCGALGGLAEYDIKRIIAYSTISQLGYMIVSTGLSLFNLALWHLVNHALFKALLFLSAGALIHALLDVQDLRRYGSLRYYLPILLNTFLLGNLSIMAFPFFTGFYSKDLILEYALNSSQFEVFLLIALAAILTALYSLKLFVSAFLVRPNSGYSLYTGVHTHMPLEYIIPFMTLGIGAVIFGYLSSVFMPTPGLTLPVHFIEFGHQSLIFGTVPLVFYYLLSIPGLGLPRLPSFIHPLQIFNNLYNAFITSFLHLSSYMNSYFDKGLLEVLFGGTGLTKLAHWIAFRLELISTGYFIHIYLLFFIVFSSLFFFI